VPQVAGKAELPVPQDEQRWDHEPQQRTDHVPRPRADKDLAHVLSWPGRLVNSRPPAQRATRSVGVVCRP
jgi:hypothetical protein